MTTATTIDAESGLVTAGTYDIDPVHSRVGFAVKHLGINVVRGRFHRFEGTIEAGDDVARLTAIGAVEADSIDSAFAQRDDHLRSPDFFDVENHPTMSFAATGITPVDQHKLQMTGDITIRGVTKPIVLDVELTGNAVDQYDNLRLGLSAKSHLSRSDFGMSFGQAVGGVPLVADKIELALDIEGILRH